MLGNIESGGSVYLLMKDYPGKQPKGKTYYGRIRRQDLLDLGNNEDCVRVIYHDLVLDFSKDTVFMDEVMPEIEPDSYRELISDNIDNYEGRNILRVIDRDLAN